MALETAVVPRDTRLAHLERSLAEKTDIVHELRQQRSMYLSQISDANQRLAEMESRMASLQSTIQEKDSLIHMMQQSFLDPDDCSNVSLSFSQEDSMSSTLHHSPVSAKKFSLNGATIPLSLMGSGGMSPRGSEIRSHYDQLSLQTPPPPLPPMSSYHHRYANGAHAHGGRTSRHSEGSSRYRGYQIELGSPVKGYSNICVPSSPVKGMQYERSGSLSPVKRPNDRGPHNKYYTLELSDDVMDGSPYHRGQLQPAGGGYGGSHGSPVTSAHHKLSAPSSNSAPNSPNVRKVHHHRPRTSQPNLHQIHAPVHGAGGGGSSRQSGSRDSNLSTLTRLGSPPKYRNPKGVKSNTGDMKRNQIQPPTDVEVKSKTPPPNYKLHHQHHPQADVGQSARTVVGTGGGKENSPGAMRKSESGGSPLHRHRDGLNGHKRLPSHQKQRHHSVDDVLNGQEISVENRNLNLSMNSNSSGSLALFESLIGDALPKTSSPLVGNVSGSGSGRRHGRRHIINSHRHSKSSPTRELIHL